MTTVLLVTADAALGARVERALGDASIFTAADDAEALKIARLVDLDAVFRDAAGAGRALREFAARIREAAPGATLVLIGAEGEDAALGDVALPRPFTEADLKRIVRQIEEKQGLLGEIAALRAQATAPAPPADPDRDTRALNRILTEFSRVLAAGFDLHKVSEMFLDAVAELVRPTRLALLMPDDGGAVFRVRAHRGLAPQVATSVKLPASTGLARWLAVEGRPARLPEITDQAVARDLRLLAGAVAVPLLASGELVAILVVGRPVVGANYGRHETEVLFDVASHLGAAIRQITLHEALRRQKAFNERILAHMSSGVVTLDRDETIRLFNRRAEEILGLTAAEVVGRDLRALPSPLGDLLYDTLRTGEGLPPTEVHLARRDRWLEVTTYPIRGDEPRPLGSVLVFDDHTEKKELAARRRQDEQTQLLTNVVARIADEIKNPLVSINTFVELIEERFDEPYFRKTFADVVRRDTRRLVQVFEKLSGLVSGGELHSSTVNVWALVDEVITAIEMSDEGLGKRVQIDVDRDAPPQLVTVDRSTFKRALSYLICHLSHNSPGDNPRVSISAERERGADGEHVHVLVASRTAQLPPDKLDKLFDPVQMVQESLIDVGPAVSQRLVEALGGRLTVRQGRHELQFQIALPAA
jgi:PAS domain S-box-containing protein